jgi:hypothetical protein
MFAPSRFRPQGAWTKTRLSVRVYLIGYRSTNRNDIMPRIEDAISDWMLPA